MNEKKKLLSTKEAAEYCGFKLSYFRKLMMREPFPCISPRASCVSSSRRISTHSSRACASPRRMR